jgi:hypothetical protein
MSVNNNSPIQLRRQTSKAPLLIAADHVFRAAALVAQTRSDVLSTRDSMRLGRLADGLHDLVSPIQTLAQALSVQNLPHTPFMPPPKHDRHEAAEGQR